MNAAELLFVVFTTTETTIEQVGVLEMCRLDLHEIRKQLASQRRPQAEFFLNSAGWKEILSDIRLSRIIAINKKCG